MDLVQAVTGWSDFGLDELLEIGDRRLNTMFTFDASLGLDRQAERLPARFLQPLTGSGPTASVAPGSIPFK